MQCGSGVLENPLAKLDWESKDGRPMNSTMTPDNAPETPATEASAGAELEADSSQTPAPIGDLVMLPDFPQCALNQLVDIRGQVGVVVGIRNNSIKLRSLDGSTQSFNALRLRTLYAPMVRHEQDSGNREVARAKPDPETEEEAADSPERARNRVENPDFSTPVKPISNFARQPDFPRCALGQHVEISGFVGVVVEIVKESVKVRSVDGTGRSYNAVLLQKLHGRS